MLLYLEQTIGGLLDVYFLSQKEVMYHPNQIMSHVILSHDYFQSVVSKNDLWQKSVISAAVTWKTGFGAKIFQLLIS